MSNENHVTIIGNVTRDPEARFTRGGKSMLTFGIANNRRWRNQATNEWEEEASFYDVTAWGDLGENVGGTITRGMRVTITGRLQQRSWEAEDGSKRSKVEIVADDVAVSLRWCTATIEKADRAGGGGGGGQSRSSATRSGARGSGRSLDDGNYGLDEEPF